MKSVVSISAFRRKAIKPENRDKPQIAQISQMAEAEFGADGQINSSGTKGQVTTAVLPPLICVICEICGFGVWDRTGL